MYLKDKTTYLNRYNKRLKEYGYDSKSLGWGGGRERQDLRYKVLKEIGVLSNESILDVGCGFGDLYDYCLMNNWQGEYLGIDINQNLLNVAINQYPSIKTEKIDLLEDKFEQKFDWVLSSGVFNAKLEAEDNIGYITKMLTKMFTTSNKGVACDFMTTYVDYQHPIAYHLDPAEAIAIGKKLTDRLIIRMDYLKYEFCLYLYK